MFGNSIFILLQLSELFILFHFYFIYSFISEKNEVESIFYIRQLERESKHKEKKEDGAFKFDIRGKYTEIPFNCPFFNF